MIHSSPLRIKVNVEYKTFAYTKCFITAENVTSFFSIWDSVIIAINKNQMLHSREKASWKSKKINIICPLSKQNIYTYGWRYYKNLCNLFHVYYQHGNSYFIYNKLIFIYTTKYILCHLQKRQLLFPYAYCYRFHFCEHICRSYIMRRSKNTRWIL